MNGIQLLLIIGIVISLNACVESQSSLEQYVEQIKKTAKSRIEPIAPPKQIKSEQYTAETMRSPFVLTGGNYTVPAVLTGPGGELIKQAARPDINRPREYLEQFPLSSITMVGTLSKPEMNWGLVKDANGMIHAVKIGDYMGQNSGQIIAITPDQIRLNETVPNGVGGWTEARTNLTLTIAVAPEPDTTTKPAAKSKSQTQSQSNPVAGAGAAGVPQSKTPQVQQGTPIQQRAVGGR